MIVFISGGGKSGKSVEDVVVTGDAELKMGNFFRPCSSHQILQKHRGCM